MRRFLLLPLCAFVAAVSLAASPGQSVGLVLSGGGAKGIAHIGVIQAFEENDIPIDYVTGTSMGAIVGALYAAGYSPDEMMSLLKSNMFANASTGTIDPDLRYYLTSPPLTPQILRFSLGNDSIAAKVPWSLISPTPMNFAFMEVFADASAVCNMNFDHLFVPLRTVSSNIAAQRPEVSRGGSLADAVRASMSFPMVFCPIEINDTLHYDGGIFDNFPVGVMQREFNPDFMLGVDVHTEDSVPAPPTALNQINNLVTRAQTYDMPSENSIRLHLDLHEYSLLDFNQADAIYDIGYRRGLEMIDSIKTRVSARRSAGEVASRRKEFKDKFVEMRFSDVVCTGGSEVQNAFLRAQFPRGDFGIEGARTGFYRAISGDLLKDLRVQAVPVDTGGYLLKLKAFPKPSWSAGLGGYISSSTMSMLFASVNYNSLSQRALSGHLDAWIGQSYMATQLMTTVRFGAKTPYSIAIQGVISKQVYTQTEKLFFNANEPKFVNDFQAYGRAYLLQLPCGSHAAASLSVGYGYERYKFANDAGIKIKSYLRLGQVAMRYDYNTLNAVDYPTSGLEIHASAMGMLGKRYYNFPVVGNEKSNWLQGRIKVRKYFNFSNRFSFGLEGELLASNRKTPLAYDAAVAEAPGYTPTPSCFNSFNASFRAYSYLGAGLTPVWKVNSQLQLRGTFHIFAPWQSIEHGEGNLTRLSNKPGIAQFFGEAQAVYNFKVASVCLYANYRTGSRDDRGWHVGLSLGIFALAPDFLK